MPRRKEPPRLYHRKDEGVWIILDEGKQIRTGCSTEEYEEAKEKLLDYLNTKSNRYTQEANSAKITLGEILGLYIDDVVPDHKDKSRTVYAINALAPYWANLTPNDISTQRTREYADKRDVSNSTVRRELGVLQAALNHAEIEIGLRNLPKIKLPKKSAPRTRWLRRSEYNSLHQNAPEHLKRFLMISVLTGRRKKAVLGLGWEQSPNHGWIDLENGMIHFKGTAEIESNKRRGSITMPKQLWEHAKEWHKDGNPTAIHFRGERVSDIDTSFENACIKSGLEDVVPHTLKHTAITWAFQNGMTLEDALDYFATSVPTLMDVYRQHSPKHQERAVAVMDQIGNGFIAGNVAEQERAEV